MNDNRKELRVVELALSNPRIRTLDFVETLKVMGLDLIFPLLPFAGLGFGVGYTGGWIAADYFTYDHPRETALMLGCLIALAACWVKFDLLIAANLGHYSAEFDEAEEEPAGDDFIRVDHDSPNQTRRVSEAMLARLKVLAENYERLGETLAVQTWYRNGGPMSRTQIEAVRAFLLEYGYADEKAGGQMELNGKGERALGEWRMGNFGRLSPSLVGGNHGA